MLGALASSSWSTTSWRNCCRSRRRRSMKSGSNFLDAVSAREWGKVGTTAPGNSVCSRLWSQTKSENRLRTELPLSVSIRYEVKRCLVPSSSVCGPLMEMITMLDWDDASEQWMLVFTSGMLRVLVYVHDQRDGWVHSTIIRFLFESSVFDVCEVCSGGAREAKLDR
jgi:hypothetical protein